ncbi:alpha-L-fucosidase 2 [Anseongella ginsenosidimutans]|uniref:Alpha-L-fucosidase 2 n=1 Tax=Anseongella ginsenosidimutans TaxID=496056 RepID=A0A4V2UTQ8_9SPHI|nr:glycoside hydrolase family 95 protein [Anseongella ginsenosidimutans]QEC52876.1 glycoside hydrolase family 95 protein [Anseongella ginsenosidimutans]TCS87266.1 alpha-L-fucosidase 2 [Anseongella ginsenosidimutans]
MKLYFTAALFFCVLTAFSQQSAAPELHRSGSRSPEPAGLELWYRQPASEWVEALPVGNGRLGAMVFGGVNTERIQINEESLWAGNRFNDNNPNALEVLDTVRKLLFADKNAEASAIAQENMVAVREEGSDSIARSFRSYQSLMDLHIDFGRENGSRPQHYKRSLDLVKGIAVTSYELDGVIFTEEVFASAPDDVLMIRLTASEPGKLNATFRFTRWDDDRKDSLKDCRVTTRGTNGLLLRGQVVDEAGERGPGGAHMKFAGLLRVMNKDGELLAGEGELVLRGASEAMLYITGATNYDFENLSLDPEKDPVAACDKDLDRLVRKKYVAIKAAHVSDHTGFMNRVSFHLGAESKENEGSGTVKADIPTDLRLENVKKGAEDQHLTELYFQYGRYLLLGSSRAPGLLPSNLQGIWNPHLNAPWQSDFHTNINLQMNYWPAEVGNLSETTAPLFAFMDKLRLPGRATAREMYGADGWVMHHCTDAFGKTGLQNSVWWGTFPMATGWMCLHFWDHYLYGKDESFLREKAYPIMKEHAAFLEDYLVEGPKGMLVTAPAYSPENRFIHPITGKEEYLTYAPTMDNQIIREFLQSCIKAANVLKEDKGLVQKWKGILARIPETKTGSDGRILEWIKEYKEAEPGHRHMSHVFGLHPGTQISPETPELFEGVRKTLEFRLKNGGGHTGWSRAWMINIYARLLDGEAAHFHLQKLFEKSTLSNLFDTHPPFQIDGNFGGTAGIAEMLLQSHLGKVELLPALPKAWQEGSVSGLRARGGLTVSINWEQSRLTGAKVRADQSGDYIVASGGREVTLRLKKGEEIALDEKLERK